MIKRFTYLLGRSKSILLVPVLVGASLVASGSARAETTTPISQEAARGIIGTKLNESEMIPSTKLCLYYVGGDTLKDRLDKMFLVAMNNSSNNWYEISIDLADWLVLGPGADSWSAGFGLKLSLTNGSTATIKDFGGPGNDIAPGGLMEVSIPKSKAGVLKGCILNYDGARIIEDALANSGEDRQALDNYILEYRSGAGLDDESSEDDAIDPNDIVGEAGNTASVDTSGSKDALATIYGYLSDAVGVLSLLMGAILVGSTIFAGIQYTTAGADSGKVSKAKSRLASNVVVLAIYLFSATVLNWILPG